MLSSRLSTCWALSGFGARLRFFPNRRASKQSNPTNKRAPDHSPGKALQDWGVMTAGKSSRPHLLPCRSTRSSA